MKQLPRKHDSGFTLLELLIALSIFALLTLMAYQALDAAVVNRELNQQRMQQLEKLDRLFFILGKDLLQTVNRPILDETGERQPGLVSAEISEYPSLEFSHHGRLASVAPVFYTPQRSRFWLDTKTGELYRDIWPVLDRAPDTKPLTTLLSNNILAVTYQFIDNNNSTHKHWPYYRSDLAGDVQHLPVGVTITLTHKTYGEITRHFPIGG